MIKIQLICIAFLMTFSLQALDIRTDFHNGMFEEDELTKIAETNYYPSSNLVLAYKGISKTMLADHVYLPTSKLSYFNDGKADLEKAIKTEPNNPELRYLRVMVQLNAPFFLGYSSNIDSDVSFFIKHLPSFDISETWKNIFIDNLVGTESMLAADALTADQKKKIKALKTN